MKISLNIFITNAIAVLLIYAGNKVKYHIKWLQKFFIPTPVVGGLIYIFIVTFLKQIHLVDINPDFTLSDCFMLLFYASIGFTASADVLRKSGKKVISFLGLSVTLAIFQNILGIGLSVFFNINPLIGLACGSISMTGGHGTSAAFADILARAGLSDSMSISLAAATFGLIAGGLIGGPIGKYLLKDSLPAQSKKCKKMIIDNAENSNIMTHENIVRAIYYLIIAIALGNIISAILERIGFTFPASVGAMLASSFFTNLYEHKYQRKFPITEIKCIGNVSLMLFLTLSMMTIKPWQLIDVAIPILIILLCQVILMALFAVFITYRFMGRNKLAAVIASGHCGFGLGAVPTAVANMSSLDGTTDFYPEAFMIVPIVGSLFINFFNSIIITFLINFI